MKNNSTVGIVCSPYNFEEINKCDFLNVLSSKVKGIGHFGEDAKMKYFFAP